MLRNSNLVRVDSQLGSSGVWMQATPERLVIHDLGIDSTGEDGIRLVIAIGKNEEKQRVIQALKHTVEFLQRKLATTE